MKYPTRDEERHKVVQHLLLILFVHVFLWKDRYKHTQSRLHKVVSIVHLSVLISM